MNNLTHEYNLGTYLFYKSFENTENLSDTRMILNFDWI